MKSHISSERFDTNRYFIPQPHKSASLLLAGCEKNCHSGHKVSRQRSHSFDFKNDGMVVATDLHVITAANCYYTAIRHEAAVEEKS
jgi:hypothetical protein